MSASGPYRWNVATHAVTYDAAAQFIHPHYLEIQNAILNLIERPADAEFLLVDLGGGSGRLAEKFLNRFPRARAIVVDQSEAFLALAERRLAAFAGRGQCLVARLQDDWKSLLPAAPEVITSMSAIHHLSPDEKFAVYQQAYEALAPGGQFFNGDEIRAVDDETYVAQFRTWGAHMRGMVAAGKISQDFSPMLDKWEDRNIHRWDQPRTSGDDWHEKLDTQLGYLARCGFRHTRAAWQQQLWAVMTGTK